MSETDPHFEELLEFLRDARGFDFTGYKRSSLARRVRQRMDVVAAPTYAEYFDYLQFHPDEFTALFNTILINVTGFFRDREAWDQLQQTVLPPILADRAPSEPVRAWSAGCASGEEAFTVAMVLAELLGPEQFRDRVKIYATDVDEDALARARSATYAEDDVAAVPAPLRDRYFECTGQRFTFRTDLRRSVIFGRNDLVQDAPISRVDLLVCRNTLMYLTAETQAQVLGRFHFALEDSGVLLLGKAEMLLNHGNLFVPVDLKRRIFRRVPDQGRSRPDPVGTGQPAHAPAAMIASSVHAGALLISPVAALLVGIDGRLSFVNRQAEALFGLSEREVGRPFTDLEVSYRPVELRDYIERSLQERRPARIRDVQWRSDGEPTYLDAEVVPLMAHDGGAMGTAIFFSDVTRHHNLRVELQHANRQLETAHEELQSTVEELETTNEELQSTVEELETTNEELQATNDELETMNEELQSTNDELQSINETLRQRTAQLHEANAYLSSILASLNVAVVVVDADLVIRAWNRHAEELWGLRVDETVGQHLLNLDIGLSADSLKPALREVLTGGCTSRDVQLRAVNRHGREVDLRIVCTPLELGDEMPGGAIVLMDDSVPVSD